MPTKRKRKPRHRRQRAALRLASAALPAAAYNATGFPEAAANSALRFAGHMPPPYDESMPVYRADGGGYYSFDSGAVCWVFTPNNPIGADQTAWIYRSADENITSA
jgi:hypothetical protein